MFRIIVISILSLMLVGCSTVTGERDLMEDYQELEMLVDNAKWKEVQKKFNKFDEIYEENKWKIELVGDEGEFESLQETMEQLKVAIEMKDEMLVKSELKKIKVLLENIYSF